MDPQDKYRPAKPRNHRSSIEGPPSLPDKSSLGRLSACISKLVRRTRDLEDKNRKCSRRQCKTSSSVSRHSPLSAGFQRKRTVKSAGGGFSRRRAAMLAGTARESSHMVSRAQGDRMGVYAAARSNTESRRHQLSNPANVESSTVAPRYAPHVPPNTPSAREVEIKEVSGLTKTDNHISPPFNESTNLLDRSYDHCYEAFNNMDNDAEGYVSARSSSNFASDLCSLSFGPSTTLSSSLSPERFSQPASPTLGIWGNDAPYYYDGAPDYVSSQNVLVAEDKNASRGNTHLPSTFSRSSDAENRSEFALIQEVARLDPRCYSLPEAEHGSTLTLKPVNSTVFDPADYSFAVPPTETYHDAEIWNGGSQDHMTALSELVDDHGYLSEIIH